MVVAYHLLSEMAVLAYFHSQKTILSILQLFDMVAGTVN